MISANLEVIWAMSVKIRPPWVLCLDRTNWKVGRRDVNILMLAVVTRRLRIPLMWTVLDKAGSSNQCERIALMRRYLALFGPRSIAWLLADREFKACPREGGGAANGYSFCWRTTSCSPSG